MHNAQYTHVVVIWPFVFGSSLLFDLCFFVLLLLFHVPFIEAISLGSICFDGGFFVAMSAVYVHCMYEYATTPSPISMLLYFHSILNYCDAVLSFSRTNVHKNALSYGFLFNNFCEIWRDKQTLDTAKPNKRAKRYVYSDRTCPLATIVAWQQYSGDSDDVIRRLRGGVGGGWRYPLSLYIRFCCHFLFITPTRARIHVRMDGPFDHNRIQIRTH